MRRRLAVLTCAFITGALLAAPASAAYCDPPPGPPTLIGDDGQGGVYTSIVPPDGNGWVYVQFGPGRTGAGVARGGIELAVSDHFEHPFCQHVGF